MRPPRRTAEESNNEHWASASPEDPKSDVEGVGPLPLNSEVEDLGVTLDPQALSRASRRPTAAILTGFFSIIESTPKFIAGLLVSVFIFVPPVGLFRTVRFHKEQRTGQWALLFLLESSVISGV